MMISLISSFLTDWLLRLTVLNIYKISVQLIFTLGVGFNTSLGWLFCVICNLVFAQFLGSVFLFISFFIVLLLLVLAFGRSGLFCDICNLAFTPFFQLYLSVYFVFYRTLIIFLGVSLRQWLCSFYNLVSSPFFSSASLFILSVFYLCIPI